MDGSDARADVEHGQPVDVAVGAAEALDQPAGRPIRALLPVRGGLALRGPLAELVADRAGAARPADGRRIVAIVTGPRGPSSGADLLAHEADVGEREAGDGEREQRDHLRPDEEEALVERQERRDPLLRPAA